jgi:hypothetical protein
MHAESFYDMCGIPACLAYSEWVPGYKLVYTTHIEPHRSYTHTSDGFSPHCHTR